jgi:predicted alpha/beta hydrolase family esterase
MRAKVVIIYGTGGNPQGNWFPWLKNKLIDENLEVLVPAFPTIKGQSLKNWTDVFAEQIGSIDKNMILIGHSIGAGFILSLLEASKNPVIASYLVCGFLGKLGLPAYDLVNESFVCRDFDWQKIKNNAGNINLICSDDDPYVPLYKSQELAQKLDVELTLLPGTKHINEESSFTSFPFLCKKIKADLATAK